MSVLLFEVNILHLVKVSHCVFKFTLCNFLEDAIVDIVCPVAGIRVKRGNPRVFLKLAYCWPLCRVLLQQLFKEVKERLLIATVDHKGLRFI